jgi:hypothetical protein
MEFRNADLDEAIVTAQIETLAHHSKRFQDPGSDVAND